MLNYIATRVIQALVVLVLVSILVFLIMYLVPGDAVTVLAGPDPTPEVVDALRRKLGLDQPLPVQYVKWALAALQGDLGVSYIIGRPVSELIATRLPATLELAFAAILIASFFGIMVGIVAAQRQGTWVDGAITAANSFVLSIPNFWFGILGIITFAVWLGWLPSGGRKLFSEDPLNALQYLIMPAVALSLDSIAMIARLVRASVLDELSRDYVTVARAKGVGKNWLMRRHIARNAAIPVLTVLGLRFGQMLGGAVLIEAVFNWPGLGRLTVEAIKNRDVVLVQGTLMYFVVIYMAVNLLIDLSYGLFDPRVRSSAGGKV
ncbi:ABC transporter permease [Pacificibacter marinus]|uniref:ABC transporter permease n=1 Tax=Pacificibacter marinus TaxID=658057 RepID=UPI001C07ECE0|nr:ABC transporter permease [Pacificibacter marinus]MBU2867292.1 ABC transporter permease [Pacificibacter marinus]